MQGLAAIYLFIYLIRILRRTQTLRIFHLYNGEQHEGTYDHPQVAGKQTTYKLRHND